MWNGLWERQGEGQGDGEGVGWPLYNGAALLLRAAPEPARKLRGRCLAAGTVKAGTALTATAIVRPAAWKHAVQQLGGCALSCVTATACCSRDAQGLSAVPRLCSWVLLQEPCYL